MKRMPLLAFIVASIVAIVVAGVFITSYVVTQLNDDDTPAVQPSYGDTAADKLYLAGRDEFSICVDGAGEASSTTAQVDAVREALGLALGRLSEVPTQYAVPNFVQGCPDAAVLSAALAGEQLDRRARKGMTREKIIGDLGPSTISPHRAFVYFVDPDTYSAAFGTEPYASTGEEFVCEGICSAVTRALYVPVGTQNEVIQDGLLEVLSLLTLEQLQDLSREGLGEPTVAP